MVVDLVVLYHASINNTNRLFICVCLDQQVLSYLAHTHTYDTSALPAAAWWHRSAHWVRQNGHWVRLRQEESREWEPMPGGRKGREREREWKWEGCTIWNTVTAPTSCLFTWILTLYSSVSPSISPSFHTHPNTHSHTLHSSDCLYIPCDRPYSPLLLYCPSPSPFNIKPLTLCGKWAHSPIQCLLRHDVSEFYIKTDKAGLGCRSG